jgi:hypothetical protein
MLYRRLPLCLLVLALGLGLMSGVLLAQHSEENSTPIDCSAQGLDALMQGMSERYPTDFALDTTEATANLYRRGLVYQQIALDCGYTPSTEETTQGLDPVAVVASAALPVGNDPLASYTQIEGLTGDAEHGNALFNGKERVASDVVLGCSSCHTGGSLAPASEKIWDNTVTTRLKLPRFSAYTPEQYIVESIIKPDAYGSAGYVVAMPHDFGERLLAQELADLVAYLHSLSTVVATDN